MCVPAPLDGRLRIFVLVRFGGGKFECRHFADPTTRAALSQSPPMATANLPASSHAIVLKKCTFSGASCCFSPPEQAWQKGVYGDVSVLLVYQPLRTAESLQPTVHDGAGRRIRFEVETKPVEGYHTLYRRDSQHITEHNNAGNINYASHPLTSRFGSSPMARAPVAATVLSVPFGRLVSLSQVSPLHTLRIAHSHCFNDDYRVKFIYVRFSCENDLEDLKSSIEELARLRDCPEDHLDPGLRALIFRTQKESRNLTEKVWQPRGQPPRHGAIALGERLMLPPPFSGAADAGAAEGKEARGSHANVGLNRPRRDSNDSSSGWAGTQPGADERLLTTVTLFRFYKEVDHINAAVAATAAIAEFTTDGPNLKARCPTRGSADMFASAPTPEHKVRPAAPSSPDQEVASEVRTPTYGRPPPPPPPLLPKKTADAGKSGKTSCNNDDSKDKQLRNNDENTQRRKDDKNDNKKDKDNANNDNKKDKDNANDNNNNIDNDGKNVENGNTKTKPCDDGISPDRDRDKCNIDKANANNNNNNNNIDAKNNNNNIDAKNNTKDDVKNNNRNDDVNNNSNKNNADKNASPEKDATKDTNRTGPDAQLPSVESPKHPASPERPPLSPVSAIRAVVLTSHWKKIASNVTLRVFPFAGKAMLTIVNESLGHYVYSTWVHSRMICTVMSSSDHPDLFFPAPMQSLGAPHSSTDDQSEWTFVGLRFMTGKDVQLFVNIINRYRTQLLLEKTTLHAQAKTPLR